MSFIYLASPYSVKADVSNALAARIRKTRFEKACRYAAKLMLEGNIVFCPIAHSHPIEVLGMDGIMDGDFWLKQDFAILQEVDELRVLMLDEWEKSDGIKREILFAKELGIPVTYVRDTISKRMILSKATEARAA